MEILKKIITHGWQENNIILKFDFLVLTIWAIYVGTYQRILYNPNSLLISLAILLLSTLIDRKTYGNISTWLSLTPILYILWWILLS